MQKASEAAALGRKWQESILDVCDQHFFFTQVRGNSAFRHFCSTIVALQAVSLGLACLQTLCLLSTLHSIAIRFRSHRLVCTLVANGTSCVIVSLSWLQIENFDQTTPTALQQWDDHEDLTSYNFSADDLQAPDNVDDKRKLAYRYSFKKITAPCC